MSRKAAPSRAGRSASRKKTTKANKKSQSARAVVAKTKPAKKAPRTKAKRAAPSEKRARKTTKAVARSTSQRRGSSAKGGAMPVDILSRAEADITSVIETLNNQMNAALVTFTELASSHCERGRAVVRTAPLDRATATFQRLVAEVVDDQLAEMLPPLVSLRNELAQRADAGNGENPSADDAGEFCCRGKEILEHVLALANIQVYESRVSETFDPLIHLAVGEVHREDLADGAVAEPVQPGFRSARGKVIVPAKVLVNRR